MTGPSPASRTVVSGRMNSGSISIKPHLQSQLIEAYSAGAVPTLMSHIFCKNKSEFAAFRPADGHKNWNPERLQPSLSEVNRLQTCDRRGRPKEETSAMT